jgi:hypothetical protein
MPLPNFLIIGAPKAGTTSLYHFLDQHPEVYMSPVKEPHFFAYKDEEVKFYGPGDEKRCKDMFVTATKNYKSLFKGVRKEKAIGEASAMYLYSSTAPTNIANTLKDVKLILILRNPVDRAYSSYLHLLRDNRETLDFEQALKAENYRLNNGWMPFWGYKGMGFYHDSICRYIEIFGRENILIHLYDDLTQDYSAVLKKTFCFLGISDEVKVSTEIRHNKSGIPKNKQLHFFLREKHPVKSLLKPIIPSEIRKKIIASATNLNLSKPLKLADSTREDLAREYREDIKKTSELINRNLSSWLLKSD